MRTILVIALFALASPARADDALERAVAEARARISEGFSFRLRRLEPPAPGETDLGRSLFFDKSLSADGNLACASCHDPAKGWGDGRPRALGRDGRPVRRNAPSLRVSCFHEGAFFWDGRAATLEAAVLDAASRPDEMAAPAAELTRRLRESPARVRAFARAYGRAPEAADAARAIAAFVREAATPGEAPFDRSRRDPAAMSDAAKRGLVLFAGKADCARCHSGAGFTYRGFHALGAGETDDRGRAEFDKESSPESAFRTPSLRDLKGSAPYMHDGSLPTLRAVVEFYDRGGGPKYHDGRLKKLGLTPGEQDDLIAFLESLDAPPSGPPVVPDASVETLAAARRSREAAQRRLELGEAAVNCRANDAVPALLARLAPLVAAGGAARAAAESAAEDALRYAQYRAYASGDASICDGLRGLPSSREPGARDAGWVCREGALELALTKERITRGPGLRAACERFYLHENPEFGADGAADLCRLEAEDGDRPEVLCGALVPRWLDALTRLDCETYFERYRALSRNEATVCEGIGMRGGQRLDDCHGLVAYARARKSGAAACGDSPTCRVLLGDLTGVEATLGARIRDGVCAGLEETAVSQRRDAAGDLREAEDALARAESARSPGDRDSAVELDREAEAVARLAARLGYSR